MTQDSFDQVQYHLLLPTFYSRFWNHACRGITCASTDALTNIYHSTLLCDLWQYEVGYEVWRSGTVIS